MEERQVDLLRDWLALLDGLYPPGHAEDWDQVGLHVGDPETDTVAGVLVCLDVTPDVVAEASELGADLIIAHHPLFFSPLRRLTPDTASGRTALAAARAGVAIAAAHTNLDRAADGTSHPAADAIDLQDRRPLEPLPPAEQVKLTTFVPEEAVATVLAALDEAGAGSIGDYEACSFRTPGTGRFRPGDGADPHVGDVGQPNEVAEQRVEVVLPRRIIGSVMAALEEAHPYEEVAVDVYPLLDVPGALGGPLGLGLIGALPEPTALADLAATLAERLPSPGLRLAAPERDPTRQVSRVAICGGAGDSFIGLAMREGAEVLITGDLKHHTTLDALTQGLALIDAGHHATEDPAMDAAAAHLQGAALTAALRAPVIRSKVSTDPFCDWKMR